MTEGKASTEDSIHYLCKLNALMAEKLYELIVYDNEINKDSLYELNEVN